MEPDAPSTERECEAAVDAALVHAEVLRKSSQFAEAIRTLTEALDLGLRRATIYYRLGNTYVDRGDLERAEQSYLKALDIDPDHANARHNLAIVYRRQKRIDLFVKTSKEIRQRAMDQDLPSPLRKLSPRTRRYGFWALIFLLLFVLAYFSSRG
jgi:tetratricopeptide (TPR) repeat protein